MRFVNLTKTEEIYKLKMNYYYTLLNIDENASLSDIKKAYRKQALLYHPDRNDNPKAHEQFLKIDEAYDYLVKLKTGKLHQWQAPSSSFPQKSPQELERERKIKVLRARHKINADVLDRKLKLNTFLFSILAMFIIPLFLGFMFKEYALMIAFCLPCPLIIAMYFTNYYFTDKKKTALKEKFDADLRAIK